MLVLLPDVEQLVNQYLLAHDDVTTLVEDRVYSILPSGVTFPAVRISQFADTPARAPLWLVRTSLQVDVWGGSKKLTRTIADTLRAIFDTDIVGIHAQGVVTKTATSGLNTAPDQTYTPARPRCRFDLDIWTHPATVVGS